MVTFAKGYQIDQGNVVVHSLLILSLPEESFDSGVGRKYVIYPNHMISPSTEPIIDGIIVNMCGFSSHCSRNVRNGKTR